MILFIQVCDFAPPVLPVGSETVTARLKGTRCALFLPFFKNHSRHNLGKYPCNKIDDFLEIFQGGGRSIFNPNHFIVDFWYSSGEKNTICIRTKYNILCIHSILYFVLQPAWKLAAFIIVLYYYRSSWKFNITVVFPPCLIFYQISRHPGVGGKCQWKH